jgi:hypothetical protein
MPLISRNLICFFTPAAENAAVNPDRRISTQIRVQKINALLWAIEGTGFKLCLKKQKLSPEEREFIMTQGHPFEIDTAGKNREYHANFLIKKPLS